MLSVLLYYANRRWRLEDNVTTPMGAKRIGSTEPIPEALPEQTQDFSWKFEWGDTRDFDKLDFEFSINQDFKLDPAKKPKQIGSRPHLVHDNIQTSTNIIDVNWVDDIELDIDIMVPIRNIREGFASVFLVFSPVITIPYWMIDQLERTLQQEPVVY